MYQDLADTTATNKNSEPIFNFRCWPLLEMDRRINELALEKRRKTVLPEVQATKNVEKWMNERNASPHYPAPHSQPYRHSITLSSTLSLTHNHIKWRKARRDLRLAGWLANSTIYGPFLSHRLRHYEGSTKGGTSTFRPGLAMIYNDQDKRRRDRDEGPQ